ncbi:hypothetical protein N7523_005583 [Penicillium sp. IBT 18751x]|nr:hypothetical protein N7523_005583 [Penicillium sp. IBT 18751x]
MDIKVRLRPLQAGYRVAALDGGGVFGMALLIMLRDTGEGLPSDMPMYLFFDVVACTSTGSLVGCAVFEKQLSLADCIKMFHSTAKDVFYKRVGLRARVKRYLCLWKNGAQYDIAVFCNILKDQFGVALMRGGIAERKQEIVRMAITSTTFASKLCLYRSYGDALREEEHGDYVSQKVTDLPLWQAVATKLRSPIDV